MSVSIIPCQDPPSFLPFGCHLQLVIRLRCVWVKKIFFRVLRSFYHFVLTLARKMMSHGPNRWFAWRMLLHCQAPRSHITVMHRRMHRFRRQLCPLHPWTTQRPSRGNFRWDLWHMALPRHILIIRSRHRCRKFHILWCLLWDQLLDPV